MYKKNRPVCEDNECKEKPTYTDRLDSYPLRCENHKLEDDTQIYKSVCIGCYQTLFVKTDIDLCNVCAKIDITETRGKKELTIKNALISHGITNFIQDKMSDSGCHKHRPDFLIDCDTHYIVIEVDENQHSNYGVCDEMLRMINIQQGFGGMKTLFIRFNPDKYIDSNKNKIKGVITQTRISRLISLIKSSQQHIPIHLLSFIKLYYDGDNEQNIIKPINIDKYVEKRFECYKKQIVFDDLNLLVS